MRFFTYPNETPTPLESAVLLHMDGKPLTKEDGDQSLFLIDSTWRYAPIMERSLPPVKKRSLPSHFCTAYPRHQTFCDDPQRGLASVEALYIAYILTGRDPIGLLDNYYWREQFLALNPQLTEME
jgi:pre-rRNA-processing protein TSR3